MRDRVWESSLFLCVSLMGAGKKSSVWSGSPEFSLLLVVGGDFDFSWEAVL